MSGDPFGPFDAVEDGAVLLDELRATLCKYVIFPSAYALDAVVLWIAATWGQTAWAHATRLHVTSPVKRCGKSRLLDLIFALCYHPVITVNISPAALVRMIGDDPPTLLLDEIDTVFGKKSSDNHEDLRGILNAGHQRNRPYIRCVGVGASQEVQEFPSFAMAALAGIGGLPDTIEDRSITIRLRRRGKNESVASFRIKRDTPDLQALGERLGRWVNSYLSQLGEAEPEMPVEDRAADSWEPLMAIAEQAGGQWPDRAWNAAWMLSKEAEKAADDSMAMRLLTDLKAIFIVRQVAPDGTMVPTLGADGQVQYQHALYTESILSGLRVIPEAPWASYYGRELTDRDMATLLKQFDITSRDVRAGGPNRKGYRAEDLWDAWLRYT